MCCSIPPDVYDVVVLGDGSAAFAAVFAARERGRKVGLVLPNTPPAPRLLDVLARFELTVILGCARADSEDAQSRRRWTAHLRRTGHRHPG
jgi:NADPH-dependent 2,4-dienoyl-CoA reductase/sulfur reductase-like enzyme